jgi:hypothetical protein
MMFESPRPGTVHGSPDGAQQRLRRFSPEIACKVKHETLETFTQRPAGTAAAAAARFFLGCAAAAVALLAILHLLSRIGPSADDQ